MDEVERTYGNHGRWYPVSVTVCSVCVSGERIVLGVTHISVFEVLGSVMLHAHLSVKEEEEEKSNVSIDSNDTAERHGARARVPTRRHVRSRSVKARGTLAPHSGHFLSSRPKK